MGTAIGLTWSHGTGPGLALSSSHTSSSRKPAGWGFCVPQEVHLQVSRACGLCPMPCIFSKFGPSNLCWYILGDTCPNPHHLPLPQPCDPGEARVWAFLGACCCSSHSHSLTLPGPSWVCWRDFQFRESMASGPGDDSASDWGQGAGGGGRGQGAGQTSQSHHQKEGLPCLLACVPRRARPSPSSVRAPPESGPLGKARG